MFNHLAQSSLKALGNVARMGHHQSKRNMAKVVCVLYDDPVGGYPKSYPRDLDHMVSHYPDQFGKPGQTVPTPKGKVPQVSASEQSILGLGHLGREVDLRVTSMYIEISPFNVEMKSTIEAP